MLVGRRGPRVDVVVVVVVLGILAIGVPSEKVSSIGMKIYLHLIIEIACKIIGVLA